MANLTKIEWTDATWNPIAGCSIVSPGCKNCYAMRTANRFSAIKGHKYEGTAKSVNGLPVWTGKINLVEKDLQIPLHWREPRRIFVNSMSDLFHEDVPFYFIDNIFSVINLSRNHTFQILTKRTERMLEYMTSRKQSGGCVFLDTVEIPETTDAQADELRRGIIWPLPNVWLGTSIEDQKRADERIAHLLACPAAIRFISQEPQLGPIKYREEWLAPVFAADDWRFFEPGGRGVDWIIIGGESGPGARPFDLKWARSTIEQCADFGVACFVKQLGSFPTISNGDQLMLEDKKGGDPSEWPEDLRVRQFPEITKR
jgi:protein gp37